MFLHLLLAAGLLAPTTHAESFKAWAARASREEREKDDHAALVSYSSALSTWKVSDGKVAMLRDGPWVASALKKAPEATRAQLKVAMMPFARVPGGTSNSLHIPAKIDAEKRKYVWEFIRMTTTPEWQAKFTLLTSSPVRPAVWTTVAGGIEMAPLGLSLPMLLVPLLAPLLEDYRSTPNRPASV